MWSDHEVPCEMPGEISGDVKWNIVVKTIKAKYTTICYIKGDLKTPIFWEAMWSDHEVPGEMPGEISGEIPSYVKWNIVSKIKKAIYKIICYTKRDLKTIFSCPGIKKKVNIFKCAMTRIRT